MALGIVRNLVTDFKGHYACIDYELSRSYEGISSPCISGIRGTEIPPELERGEFSSPFKIDVWAVGVLLLKACHVSEALLIQTGSLTILPVVWADDPRTRANYTADAQ